MTITYADWQKHQEATAPKARPPVTNEMKADAERARQAVEHPGFAILHARLLARKGEVQRASKTAEYALCHQRGKSADEMHRLREDIAKCSGWLEALDMALDLLPEIVKAGVDP